MSLVRPDLMARVPTLTEEAPPGSGRAPTDRNAQPLGAAVRGQDAARWADEVMQGVAPQVQALLTARLRDVLAPAVQQAVQAAVEDAVERCREPLMEALMMRLRDLLEQEVALRAPDKRSIRP
jgi:hypothetical protein